jgi:hypothetical protein
MNAVEVVFYMKVAQNLCHFLYEKEISTKSKKRARGNYA